MDINKITQQFWLKPEILGAAIARLSIFLATSRTLQSLAVFAQPRISQQNSAESTQQQTMCMHSKNSPNTLNSIHRQADSAAKEHIITFLRQHNFFCQLGACNDVSKYIGCRFFSLNCDVELTFTEKSSIQFIKMS